MEEQLRNLLAKYVSGEASSSERQEVEEWIASSSENEEAYAEMYHSWHLSLTASDKELVDTNAAYNKLVQNRGTIVAAHKTIRIYRLIAMAAASVLLISLVGFWLLRPGKKENTHVAILQEVNVPADVKKKIVLPDSTLIWLNAGTALKWGKDFNSKDRTVYLEGEAFFQVAANRKGIPFIVKTSRYTIRDIGTSFNVKSRTGDSTFETVVIEGKISVEGNFSKGNKMSEILLSKNDVLKIKNPVAGEEIIKAQPEKTPGIVISKIEKPDIYIGWKDDMLVFDGDSFPVIIKKLEHKYGVVIDLDETGLTDYQYSGSFSSSTDIKNVLSVLEETTPITCQFQGDKILIKRKK